MAKYRIHLRIEREQGKRNPETKVTWSCTFLPNTRVAGGIRPNHHRDEGRPEDAEMFGVYEAIKHAELNGQSLTRADIEVVSEGLTHIFRRGKVERSTVGPDFTRLVSSAIFDEVNARPRPLGGDA